MRALVFAAGAAGEITHGLELLKPGDIVIAANGGARLCLSIGIQPDIVVGDLDSLPENVLDQLAGSNTHINRFPARKDFTDLELALQHACSLDVSEILVYGGLGLRWDQTLANILLLASPNLSCSNIRLIDGDQELFLVSKSSPARISGKPGDTVSLIPIQGDARGITTTNLEYPLKSETLTFGISRGVSNVMTSHSALVELTAGLLVCVVIHQ